MECEVRPCLGNCLSWTWTRMWAGRRQWPPRYRRGVAPRGLIPSSNPAAALEMDGPSLGRTGWILERVTLHSPLAVICSPRLRSPVAPYHTPAILLGSVAPWSPSARCPGPSAFLPRPSVALSVGRIVCWMASPPSAPFCSPPWGRFGPPAIPYIVVASALFYYLSSVPLLVGVLCLRILLLSHRPFSH